MGGSTDGRVVAAAIPAVGGTRGRRRAVPALFVAAGLAGGAVVLVLPGPGSAQPSTAVGRPGVTLDRRVEWATLGSVEARGAALGRIASEPLVAAGVPVPEVRVADIGGATGQFDARTWVLQLSSTVLAAVEGRTTVELALVAGVARHEARHAEQWFEMARLRAGDGLDAAALEAEMGIPLAVAAAAVGQPLVPGSIAASRARAWWDSIYGAGHDHREATIAGLHASKNAYDEAVRRYHQSPSPATGADVHAAQQAFTPAYAAYRELPEEDDAFRAQTSFTN